jgi:SAM-dependent methyltransferase
MRILTACRICRGAALETIVDFGTPAQGGLFPKVGVEAPRMPLCLVRCASCGLVQLGHVLSITALYGSHYGYRSGLNVSMVEHLSDLVRKEVPQWVGELGASDAVLDIGSSDGTLLGYYRRTVRRVGIDPSLDQFRPYYQQGIVALKGFFGEVPVGGPFKVVTSIAMFYDLPDPLGFAKQVREVLAPDGVWILEQGYWPEVARLGAYDVVCHEHLEYYSLTDMKRIMDTIGLTIRSVSFNAVNGGSFRVVVSKGGPAFDTTAIVEREQTVDLETFAKHVEAHGRQLRHFLKRLKREGATLYGYGASTKGNTVLQHAELGPDLLDCMVEVSEAKRGCWTPGTHIPIVLQAPDPDYYLVMPWHFRESIVRREREYLQRGGQFIFALPQIEVVSA